MNDDTLAFLSELEQREQLASSQNESLVPAGRRCCPICGKAMGTETYPCGDSFNGVQIDVCEEHGVWLDRGELPKIIAGTKSVARRARVEAVRKAKREGKTAGYILGAWSFLLD